MSKNRTEKKKKSGRSREEQRKTETTNRKITQTDVLLCILVVLFPEVCVCARVYVCACVRAKERT